MKSTSCWLLSVGLTSSLLTGCDWVDSTGSQGSPVFETQVFLNDNLVTGPTVVSENAYVRITARRDTVTGEQPDFSWGEAPKQVGNLDTCAAVENFDQMLAADSLIDACTDPAQCEISLNRLESDDGDGEFALTTPVLKASVGLRYDLTRTDSAGRVRTEEYDFCVIAINDAPEALDDTFVVLEGTRRFVSTSETNLLTNDSDDVDVSNTEYRILPQPSIAPRFAAFLELGPDGSFTYESSLTNLDEDAFDSFEYVLSDGVYQSKATATIRVVVANQAPQLTADIPVLEAMEDELFTADLAQYFRDPEDGDLEFYFSEDSQLPDEGSLRLRTNGLLAGIPDEDDVGSYALTLIVSDGSRETEALISLEISAAPIELENEAPEYIEGVFDQNITFGNSIRTMTAVFEDPDGDELFYTMFGTRALPIGVRLNENTGVVSGRPLARTLVRGLRVEATDPFGESAVSDAFDIRVR